MIRIAVPALFLLLCYVWSAPRTVVLEDDGLFLLAAYFNGAAHPPGYPLYTGLAHLATLIPVGSVALRVHALTALFGALAGAALIRLCLNFGLRPANAIAVALALGLSPVFWSQAIIAEVYTLNVLLLLLLLMLAWHLRQCPDRITAKAVALLGLLYGLGLSNHWPLLILSTPAVLVLLGSRWRALVRLWAPLLLGGVVGLLPYAWMILRCNAMPEFCAAGPLDTWREFWFYISREGFQQVDQNAGAGIREKLLFAGFALSETARQFGWLGAGVMLLGFVRQWREWPRALCWSLLLLFLGSTLVLAAVLGFNFDLFHRNTFRVYPLPAYAAAAIWLGLGWQWLAQRLERLLPGSVVLQWGAVLLLTGSIGFPSAALNNRSQDRWAAEYGEAVLRSLPQGAIFYGNADTVIGPLGYLLWIEGRRSDISLQTGARLEFGGKLYRPYAMAPGQLAQLLDEFIGATSRPIFYSNDFPHHYGVDDYGIYLGVRKDADPGARRVVLGPSILSWLGSLVHRPDPADPWQFMHTRLLRADYCRLILSGVATGAIASGAQQGPACTDFRGHMLQAEAALLSNPQDGEEALRQAQSAEQLSGQMIYQSDQARLHWLKSRIFRLLGRTTDGERERRLAWSTWPHSNNPAHQGKLHQGWQKTR